MRNNKPHQLGVIGPDKPDERDYKFKDFLAGSNIKVSKDNVYEDYTLRPYIGKILDQGYTNSCTGHSAMYAMNVLLNRINNNNVEDYNINPWWVYYWARKLSRFETKDEGAYMRDLVSALSKYGVYCSPNLSTPQCVPSNYDLGSVFKIKEYFRIYNDLDDVKFALSKEHLPVFASVRVDDNMLYSTDGIITNTAVGDIGYHAICLTGLKTIDGIQYVEFANSWGEAWGDNGFGYIHPDCIKDRNFTTDIFCPTYSYN